MFEINKRTMNRVIVYSRTYSRQIRDASEAGLQNDASTSVAASNNSTAVIDVSPLPPEIHNQPAGDDEAASKQDARCGNGAKKGVVRDLEDHK